MADQQERSNVSLKKITVARFIGFMAVIHICLLFEPIMTSSNSEHNLQELILSTGTYAFEIMGVILMCVALLSIRRKGKFHREQTVFWPSRCRHCARVLNQDRGLHREDSNIQRSVERISEDSLSSEERELSLHLIRG